MQQLSINMQISSMFLTTVVSLLLLQQIADGYYLPTNRLKRNYAIQSQAIDSEFYRINVAEEHPNVICTARRRCLTYNKYEENCEIALHSVEAFVTAKTFVDNFYADSNSPKYVILDSGCGLGKSSVILAKENPDIAVIAIDKSIHRLSKNKLFDGRIEEPIQSKRKVLRQLLEGDDKSEMVAPTQRKRILPPKPTNLLLLRAELEDFWVLAHRDSDWIVHSHYLLYPNPYPKTKHLFRRWHGKNYHANFGM